MDQFRPNVLLIASIISALWLLTRIFDYLMRNRRRRRQAKNFVRLIYAEIDFNTKDLLFFIESARDLSVIKKALNKSPNLIPHITDAHHNVIYRQNIEKLPTISNELIAQIVLFYGLLEKIKGQIEGLNLPSYKTVSPRGQLQTIEQIVANVTECEALGKNILASFSKSYPRLSLHRQHRSLRV